MSAQPDPFRLRVLKVISKCLKEIVPANGYFADLSDFKVRDTVLERVYRGRERFGESDPLPMISLLEHPKALDGLEESDGGSKYVRDWVLLIQGFVQDDPEHPTDPAHKLCAEVIKRLAIEGKRKGASPGEPNIFGLGSVMPTVTKLTIGSPVVRPGDGVLQDKAFFWLTLTLKLAEDVEAPYA